MIMLLKRKLVFETLKTSPGSSSLFVSSTTSHLFHLLVLQRMLIIIYR